MLIQCCVCKKFRRNGQWHAGARLAEHDGRISHSYCPECAERAFEELKAVYRPHAKGGKRPFVASRVV